MNDRTKGLLIILFGVVAVSPDAVAVRFLSEGGTTPWTITAYQNMMGFPLTLAYTIYESGGVRQLCRDVAKGKLYYAAAVPVQTAVNICITLAFNFTDAAQALLLINLNPLWCAVFGRLFLGDYLPRRTYLALFLAMGCILLIFVPQVVERNQNQNQNRDDGAAGDQNPYADTELKGNMLAFLAGLSLAGYISIVRWAGKADENINMVGTASLGGLASFLVAVIVERGIPLPSQFWTGTTSLFWLAVVGEGLMVCAIFVSMSIAPKFITGTEVGLCILLEAILGPLFVFFAYKDVPSIWTLIGGSLLLVVLVVHESYPLFHNATGSDRRLSMRKSSQAPSVGASIIEESQMEVMGTNGTKESALALDDNDPEDQGRVGELKEDEWEDER